MIRNATTNDVSRIAEILIFAKRMAYRDIFHNDAVSFNEMQVVPLAMDLQKAGALDNIVVYDNGIVKGMMNRKSAHYVDEENSLEICQFYIDPFFQRNGIGRSMMESLFQQAKVSYVKDIFLWVLEKNDYARRFYEESGFVFDGTKKLESGTEEYVLRYFKNMNPPKI